MTQDEIIELARQAGGVPFGDGGFIAGTMCLVTFAKLVAAKEREACAKVCQSLENNDADWDSHHWNQAIQRCEYAIRARGEK